MQKKLKLITSSLITVMFLGFICVIFVKNIMVPLSAVKSFYNGTGLSQISQNFENQFNSSFPEKTALVDINGLSHRLFAQRRMSSVVLLNNGQASTVVAKAPDEGIRANAESLTEFSQWFRNEKNGNFLYVQVPLKNSKYDDQLPAGLVDYSNDTADRFLAYLEGNVDTLDLRETMEADGVDFYSMYLSSEHHWNAYGAFYAHQKICGYMAERYGEVVDPMVLDLKNYEQQVFQDYSLGYYGQLAGDLFVGYDDFSLIYPKFETEQSCTIVHRDVVRSGSFYDAVFDFRFMDIPARDRGLYRTFVGGDFPLVIHKSETAKNPGVVMMFIDSFGTPVESYLTTAFQTVVAVDLRWVLRSGMEGTAVDFVNRFEPDTVIVMFNPNQIGSAESEQFMYGLS